MCKLDCAISNIQTSEKFEFTALVMYAENENLRVYKSLIFI